MGGCLSPDQGNEFNSNQQAQQQYFSFKFIKSYLKSTRNASLSKNQFSTINKSDITIIKNYFKKCHSQLNETENQFSEKTNKAIAVFLGLYLGDALGAFTEFLEIDQDRKIILNGFQDLEKYNQNLNYRLDNINVGCHTDDCSMAKCMAESILTNENMQFNGKDIRLRFILWWHFGYCNGMKGKISIGLGGNINDSFQEFLQQPSDFVNPKNEDINGCGSIMRLAPCAICMPDNLQDTLKMCELSNYTTHNGKESASCCRLLGYIIFRGINSKDKGKLLKEQIFLNLWTDFDKYSKLTLFQNQIVPSIQYLCQSKMEPEENLSLYPSKFNKLQMDRNWNWKDSKLNLAPTRSESTGYYGSYCMDCMYMAFYIIWHTNSFQEALFKAANLGGDCDSYGAVVGQIAGAIYGLDSEIIRLYEEKPAQFDDYHTPYLAQKLVERKGEYNKNFVYCE